MFRKTAIHDFGAKVDELREVFSTDLRLENEDQKDKSFVPFWSIQAVLNERLLTQLFTACDRPSDKIEAAVRQIRGSSDREVAKGNDRGSHWNGALRIIAILVQCDIKQDLQQILTSWIEDPYNERLFRDFQLPIALDTARTLFDFSPAEEEAFDSCQYRFSALSLQQYTHIELPAEIRMPSIVAETRELGEGANGTVYAIKVARGHWQQSSPARSSRDPVALTIEEHWLAQKTFPATNQDMFQHELAIFQKLRDVPEEYVVKPHASLSIGNDSMLFFPVAESNLLEYLSGAKSDYAEERTIQNLLAVLRKAIGLVEALVHLHQHRIYHMDIRACNIVLFPERWKLADFDQAQPVEKKTKRDWRQIRETTTTTTSDAPVQIGERAGHCFPPEVRSQSQDSDNGGQMYCGQSEVWCMGCIFLLIYIHIMGGPAKVDEFHEAMRQHWDKHGIAERFFDPKTHPDDVNEPLEKSIEERFGPSKIVQEWLMILGGQRPPVIEHAEQQNLADVWHALAEWLRLRIFEKMTPDTRATCWKFAEHLRRIIAVLEDPSSSGQGQKQNKTTGSSLGSDRGLQRMSDNVGGPSETTDRHPISPADRGVQTFLRRDENPSAPASRHSPYCDSVRSYGDNLADSRKASVQRLASCIKTARPDEDVNVPCVACQKAPSEYVLFTFQWDAHTTDLLRLLTEHQGTNLQKPNRYGRTLWQECLKRGKCDAAEWLWKHQREKAGCSTSDSLFKGSGCNKKRFQRG